MTHILFDEVQAAAQNGGAAAALETLAARLASEKRYHELFDARLMQARLANHLPVAQSANLDELPEPQRGKLEEAYLTACRECGWGLLEQGQVREAWMYLRPVGENNAVAEKLAKIEPDDDNIEQIVEVALQEGVSPRLGFELVLAHYGTCNAITTFDSELARRPLAVRQETAGLLVRHLHAELLENVRGDIARQEGAQPSATTLLELVRERDWLFSEQSYHIDATHLNSIVRAARLVDEPAVLRLALDLTEYGRRLNELYRFAGDEPFVDNYTAHGLFFAAQLGERIEEALEHFRARADSLDVQVEGTLPAEVYITLLARLGRFDEAIVASRQFLPPGLQTLGLAPSLFELCRQAGDFTAMLELTRERNDPIGFTVALLSGR